MNISVLGGGSEIGASCLHIEMNDTSILIDAGIGMHGEMCIQHLACWMLQKPEVILVTHAHANYSGSAWNALNARATEMHWHSPNFAGKYVQSKCKRCS